MPIDGDRACVGKVGRGKLHAGPICTKYKHAHRIVFVQGLPKAALGKVQKAALKFDPR